MKIIESWEDQHGDIYAVVQHTPKEQERYHTKEYEALYLLDGELNSFGGGVGYGIADFNTIEEAEEFLLIGISERDENPDVWLDMVEVR
jgi:hypothetical protein